MELYKDYNLREEEIIWMESLFDEIKSPADLIAPTSKKVPFKNRKYHAVYGTHKPVDIKNFKLVHTMELYWRTFYFYVIYEGVPVKQSLAWERNEDGKINLL